MNAQGADSVCIGIIRQVVGKLISDQYFYVKAWVLVISLNKCIFLKLNFIHSNRRGHISKKYLVGWKYAGSLSR